MRILITTILLSMASMSLIQAEDGYRLWLRYDRLDGKVNPLLSSRFSRISVPGSSEICYSIRKELNAGVFGMLGKSPRIQQQIDSTANLIVCLIDDNPRVAQEISSEERVTIGAEGYIIRDVGIHAPGPIIVVANTDKGLLYGVFHLLRCLQKGALPDKLDIIEKPSISLRVLNHWDNLDRTVERGYAGFSIWNWHELPEYIDTRYTDYARANASIGINGTVVTNVNANSLVFREDYLDKVAALADVFRAYGIRIYLTARFSSPIELGGLQTADPLDANVQGWWRDKVKEIYNRIPDFGGFLVKANSEGQPGPQDYNRTHADGANMLADALAPFGGVVMWRAFVYSAEEPDDRAKQAYQEFVPLDGEFRNNVLIQVKNGPIDFQPREPIHPLFGAMPQTPLMMEFQITKGQGTHLVGLANLYEEVLQTDTRVNGEGSTVAHIIDGSLDGHVLTGIAGVANIGTDRNWTGNLFGQADWYAFGRLAWNPDLTSREIFQEWAILTFPDNPEVTATVVGMLESSYEICVRYMTPLGLHHIMAEGHHYGPGPWVSGLARADWTSVYYHRADKEGIGFDRTSSGSNALGQYSAYLQSQYADLNTCPLPFLLWFHHVPWDHILYTGRTLWDELCHTYHRGAAEVSALRSKWQTLDGKLDKERFEQVDMHLQIQEKEARWWRDACLAYFQTFSKKTIPPDLEQPEHTLEYYKSLSFPYVPGHYPD